MGGVGWGRFVAISLLQKNWGSHIKGGVRNTQGFPIHHLTVEDSPSIAERT